MDTPENTSGEVTKLFLSWNGGSSADYDALFAVLYRELHSLAQRQVSRARPGETLRATALVNEAYLRLIDGNQLGLNDRGHFMALAARVMRNILVDKARERGRAKRGGDVEKVELDEGLVGGGAAPADVLAVDAALSRLAQLDERQAEVAQMRVFGGLSVEETAAVLGVSAITVKRDWRKARMFLIRELGLESEP